MGWGRGRWCWFVYKKCFNEISLSSLCIFCLFSEAENWECDSISCLSLKPMERGFARLLHCTVGRLKQLWQMTTDRGYTRICFCPVEVLNFFQASLRNCKNCDHNCEDHSSFGVDNVNWPPFSILNSDVSSVNPFVRANRGIMGCVVYMEEIELRYWW